MRHGLWLRGGDSTDAGELVAAAETAEAAGWDGVFVSDSLPFSQFPDPWVLLATMAAHTETIRLGTWVVPLPRRQPWQVAKEVATLDRLSGGRLILGVGLGNDDEYDAFGRPYEPRRLGARYDEALDVIAGLWSGEPFTYDGDHFTLEDAEVEPTPVQQPRVPILAGAWWPNRKPFHRGARWDGIMPFWPSLTEDGTGPRGEAATGSPTEDARAALEYYHDVTDDPGDILVPAVPSGGQAYRETCEELGATWLLTTDVVPGEDDANEHIRDGPPD